MSLQYRTSGIPDPQGKPRVYFSCHPEDFDACFGPVVEAFIHKQTCAVWYQEGSGDLSDEDLDDLELMQVFLLPVTARLLDTPNRALDVEFPFAQAHRIPVLPILMEPGLAERFNSRCGTLHLLDKTEDDPDGSFTDKLNRYLSTQLVGSFNALEDAVWFDRKVFISYRKKDRAHVQPLIRRLHQNPPLWDVGVWYDEYLVPSEDYTQAIDHTLEDCQVFLLLVTPSLLEPGNYVTAHEYPRALALKKPILPVQVVPTDRAALEALYPGLPPVVDGLDADALGRSLEALMPPARARNAAELARHKGAVGLAYFSGVQTEPDRLKGLALITASAQEGNARAIRRLMEMYRLGQGVERNGEQAYAWHQKLIEQLRRDHKASGMTVIGAELVAELNALAGYEFSRGRYDLADRAFDEAVRVYGTLDGVAQRMPYGGGTFGLVHIRQACMALELGQYDKAREHAQAAIDTYELLAKDFPKAPVERPIAVARELMGTICRQRGDMAGAEQIYLETLGRFLSIAQTSGTPEAWQDFAIGLDRLGSVYQRLGEYYLEHGQQEDGAAMLGHARDKYEEARQVYHSILSQAERDDARKGFALEVEHVADTLQLSGRLEDSALLYEYSLDQFQTLAQRLDTPESWKDVSILAQKLEELYRKQNEPQQAQAYADLAAQAQQRAAGSF